MKVLLDENLPHRLLRTLPGHEIATVAYMNWDGIKNGELLRLAEASGFDVLLSADKNLEYQQNLTSRQIAIVNLTAQDWPMISGHLAEILIALSNAGPGSFQVVDCGRFTRQQS